MQKQVITIATSISRVFFLLNGMLRKCAPCQHIAICNWNICVCKKLLIRESWRCAMLICEFSFQNFYCGGLQIPCSLHEMILYTSNILDDTNMPIFLIPTKYIFILLQITYRKGYYVKTGQKSEQNKAFNCAMLDSTSCVYIS